LINAHCHLDYTHMAGLFPPQKNFCDWIKLITTEKAHWIFSDYADSWIAGAKMLLQSGTTTVADIEAVPELLPDVWNATPLRVFSFLEMTGIRSRRDPAAILAEAVAIMDAQPPHRGDTGLSPHAPYSTSPRLLETTAALARKRKLRLVTHIAESATEFEMFTEGRGEMFDWLRRNRRDMSDCDGRSPVQHLARCNALGPHLLAVHVNHLAPGDAALLARKHVSVVHCPGSHDYFRHREFPRRELARAGVNICLGTDSLASTRKHPKRDLKLSLFREMRAFAAKHSDVSAKQILQMTTLNAARALGMAGKAGELRPGAFADLIALPLTEKSPELCKAIVHFPGEIAASMIGGEWAKTPP
jgi:cytosine/adenosine deaminase-related metal-dependent hydrolase